MNETIKTILSRRSVRSYQPKQITEEELNIILKAGTYAPSAMNQQSSHFTVVQNKEVMNELVTLAKEAVGRDQNPFYDAPTVVLVFAKRDNIAPVQDASLAIENMFLAAASLNIGSCWVNCVNRMFDSERGKELKKKIGVSEEYMSVGSCILGYPAEDVKEAAPRKEDYVNIIK
ncbi:MAG: nitroreductase [Clostridiales bacterium]|nr:nitroreductase [Clostridiales bacterium]